MTYLMNKEVSDEIDSSKQGLLIFENNIPFRKRENQNHLQ